MQRGLQTSPTCLGFLSCHLPPTRACNSCSQHIVVGASVAAAADLRRKQHALLRQVPTTRYWYSRTRVVINVCARRRLVLRTYLRRRITAAPDNEQPSCMRAQAPVYRNWRTASVTGWRPSREAYAKQASSQASRMHACDGTASTARIDPIAGWLVIMVGHGALRPPQR